MDIKDLNKEIADINPLAALAQDSDYSKIDEWISTGNYVLNAAMSGDIYGGIPNNRITCFAGESGTGKTFVLLNACREAQLLGYHIFFFDSENAVDQETLLNFDIDLEGITMIPVSTIQDFRHQATVIVSKLKEKKREGKKIPKVFFALDSASQLASAKEANDALTGSDKADMTRPKLIRSVFRVLTVPLAEIKAPFVFTNHTYEGTDLFAQTHISGGGGVLYSASNIMLFRKAQLKDKQKNKVGIILNAKAHKNRFVKPDTVVSIHINFSKGMNPYVGLQEFIGWDKIGIERGKLNPVIGERPILDESGEPVLAKSGKNAGQPKMEKYETGEFEFEPKEGNRYGFAVKHLGTDVPAAEFFTPRVFSKEILEKMQPMIKDFFMFKKESFEEGEEAEHLVDIETAE